MSDDELQRAGEPTTPAAELSLLASSPRAVVRGLVASNPNCPVEELRKLGTELPLRVMANPSIDLFLLLDHGFFKQFLLSTRTAMARSRALTGACAVALMDPDESAIGVALAKNPATPPAALAGLCVSWRGEVRVAAARNPRTPRATLAVLHAAGASPRLSTIQQRPRLSADKLARAAALGRWGELLAASSPWCPPSLLQRLVGGAEAVRLAIAANGAASAGTLEQLAAGKASPRFGAALARNPSAPPELLDELSHSIYSAVQASVARNPAAPPTALWRLAGSPDLEVRACVCRHSGWPGIEGGLVALGFAPGLACYPKAHRRRVREQDLAPLADSGPWLWWYLLLHPMTPDSLIVRLGQRSWGSYNSTLFQAASDPQTDLLFLQRLQLFSQPQVVELLSRNPRLKGNSPPR